MRHLFCTLLLFVLGFQVANAQLSGGINVGPAIPIGKYSDLAGTGFNFTVESRYAILENLNVGLNIGYVRNGYAKDLRSNLETVNNIELSTARFSVVPVTVVGEYIFGDEELRPFAGLELGAFFVSNKIAVGQAEQSESSTVLGVGLTGGVLYEIADELDVMAALKFSPTTGAIDVGTEKWSVTHLSINFGVRYRLDF
ncbi:outer membrane beta-barrel protein [Tunicatimonas pelagia]|uniref:outer membrane beta-barrel protein n=1 Tax=Tunicatimonas pelagia TaxID=931531 RepID=UPI002664EABD|nr:outer membrane beta-barrel protein [Tunicatimonas pelagia]WKN41407.1 outer membrane beta-barrel protein [Tunicatimonas pelagia]